MPALLTAALLLLAPPALTAQAAPANWTQFVDRNGGYRDHLGGYYDPRAGTYTDEEGGIVDNWAGYTYKDGSYKSGTGDYWDGPKKIFMLTTGEKIPMPDMSNEEARAVMRETAQEHGKFDKDRVLRSMIQSITQEHRLAAAK
jgi:hypothetical protein